MSDEIDFDALQRDPSRIHELPPMPDEWLQNFDPWLKERYGVEADYLRNLNGDAYLFRFVEYLETECGFRVTAISLPIRAS